jgi:hypothetical protein
MSKPEQWRDVVGYEGLYQVSDLGRVRSVDRVVAGGHGEPKKLKGKLKRLSSNRHGYLLVATSKEGIEKTLVVHRLVAAAWLGPCPDGCEVLHGEAGKADNSVANLSYGIHAQNCLDMRRDRTHPVTPVVRSDGQVFDSIIVASEESDCNANSICHCCNGRQKTAGGYGWKYEAK